MDNQPIQTALENIKEKCPAFEKGCPYATPDLKELLFSEAKSCPEFQGKCPFRNAESLNEIYEKISQVPHSKLDASHGKGLADLIGSIHSISKNLSENMGECPIFTTESGCPFKSVCTDGTPLIEKLEGFNWGQVVDQSLESIVHDIALSKELKDGTKKIHRQAERVHFVKAFLKGNVEEKLYRAFVASLYFIYKALEKESRRCSDHKMFKEIHFPDQLDRVESLEKDLQYFYGDDWEDEITMSDSVSEYVEHIHTIADKDPSLMISHHYTRYLGDLSGGQVLKKAAVKACGLPATGEGVEFYEFHQIESAREFKNMYRRKLDGIHVTKEKADELIEEAKIAFMFNIKLFKELDVLGGFMEEIVHEETAMSPEAESKKSNVCPFIVSKGSQTKSNGTISAPTDKKSSTGQCPITAIKNATESNQMLIIVAVITLIVAMLLGLGVRPVGGVSSYFSM